jgi:hypothetical protein
MKSLSYILFVFLALMQAASAEPQKEIDVGSYWLMPDGLVARMCNVTWDGNIIFGEHCFWNGNFLGRRCYLQGDPSMTKYDIFELNDNTIAYWGTFRGNKPSDPVSHSFKSPMLWMHPKMSAGKSISTHVPVTVLNPNNRSVENAALVKMRLQIDNCYDEWTIPETGATYSDVIQMTFWSDETRPESKEVYHLARGKGTIRFMSSNSGEPSGVRTAWAVEFSTKTIDDPTTPWFEVFKKEENRANKPDAVDGK